MHTGDVVAADDSEMVDLTAMISLPNAEQQGTHTDVADPYADGVVCSDNKLILTAFVALAPVKLAAPMSQLHTIRSPATPDRSSTPPTGL